MFTPEMLPVMSGLARGYAVSDRWFSSAPEPAVSGTSDTRGGQSRPESGNDELVGVVLVPVVSSQIAAVGYDPTARQLVVRFRGSDRYPEAIYSYAGVPAEVAAALVAAESPGSYFHRHIRQGGYPYRRYEGGEA
jgi:hypothetical protein